MITKEKEWICTNCGVIKKSNAKPPIVCAPTCKKNRAMQHHWVEKK